MSLLESATTINCIIYQFVYNWKVDLKYKHYLYFSLISLNNKKTKVRLMDIQS